MIEKEQIEEFNLRKVNHHKDGYNFLSKILRNNEINIENIINKLSKLEIAIPSWALGMGEQGLEDSVWVANQEI